MTENFKITNTAEMDNVLEKMSKSLTVGERLQINSTGIQPFATSLKRKVKNRKHTFTDHQKAKRAREAQAKGGSGHQNTLEEDLAIDKRRDGSVQIGFTKKSKRAYIARFLNDGWDVRNQYGGPYRHVEGEHFWEKTEAEEGKNVEKAERYALKQVLRRRGLPL